MPRNTSASSTRRFGLLTMLRSHHRVISSSSAAAQSESSATLSSSPTLSSASFEFLPTSSILAPPTTEHPDQFTAVVPASRRRRPQTEKPLRPTKVQRAFSSTSLALESEYRVDRLQGSGLDLFEPRPHNLFQGSPAVAEPVIMDGIVQVMRSG